MRLALLIVAALFLSLSAAARADLPSDPNHDGVVDLGDINYITARWLNTGTPGSLEGDANGDGSVDLGDVNFTVAHWLNTSDPSAIVLNTGDPSGIVPSAPLTTVPEPATALALFAAAVFVPRRRRRPRCPTSRQDRVVVAGPCRAQNADGATPHA